MKNKKVKIGIGVAVAIVVIVALILVVLFVRSRKSGGQTAHGESIYVDSVAELTGMNVGTDSTFTGEVEAQKTVDIKVDSDKKVVKDKIEQKEDKNMTETIKVEGMMCGNCEKHVKNALEALEGVTSAEVSRTSGQAVLTLSQAVDEAVLKKAVEDAGYQFTGIA